MKLPTLVQLAGEPAEFVKYEDGKLWYSIDWVSDDGTNMPPFIFPIAVEDAGGGAFLPKDKSLTFLRWIRKHLEFMKTWEDLQ